jgi:hypothetical protein
MSERPDEMVTGHQINRQDSNGSSDKNLSYNHDQQANM